MALAGSGCPLFRLCAWLKLIPQPFVEQGSHIVCHLALSAGERHELVNFLGRGATLFGENQVKTPRLLTLFGKFVFFSLGVGERPTSRFAEVQNHQSCLQNSKRVSEFKGLADRQLGEVKGIRYLTKKQSRRGWEPNIDLNRYDDTHRERFGN